MTQRVGRHFTPKTCRRGPSLDPKCLTNGIQHCRVAKRLVEELHGSLLKRLFPDAVVFLASDEDDRNLLLTTFQFLLKVKAGHSRHRDVEDQKPGSVHIVRREKVGRRRKSSSVKAELPEQVR